LKWPLQWHARPDTAPAAALNAVQDNVKAWLPTATPLSVADVIRLCTTTEQTAARTTGALKFCPGGKNSHALLDARQREGARLAAMLLDHLAQLRTWRNRLRP
jgi:uncharacterized protein YicC (UPF0701 family)